jgi:bifunctional non-homologous end joining protein LigD
MSATAPTIQIAGVRFTHPDKQLYPEEHIAKRDLALYYEAIAPRMLPHISRHLLSVVRCPERRGEPRFFQRHPIMTRCLSSLTPITVQRQ